MPRSRRSTVTLIVGLVLSLTAACWIVFGAELSAKQETMIVGGAEVEVRYSPTATAEDLMLPFHPGAEVEESFSYTVVSTEGRPVVSYASAILRSSDALESVVEGYRAELPGNPEPAVLGEGEDRRHVLAVGNDEEVRRVTVYALEDGCRIALVRATKPVQPAKPLRPTRPQQRTT